MEKETILQSIRENRELLEKRNAEGIEAYRKGNFTLHLPNRETSHVKVKQLRHAFRFGTTAFMLGSFEAPEKEEKYKQLFANIFNLAVVPFYWSDLEPEEGKPRFHRDSVNIYRRPAPDVVLDFCREYHLEPKGHCLVWNHFVPAWLEKYTQDERRAILERRVREIAEEYADKIPSFDVVNESATNYRLGKESLFPDYDEYGFLLGGKYLPNNIKIANEASPAVWENYRTQGKYMAFRMQLREFLPKKLPIDEIGIQYHIFARTEEMAEDGWRDGYLNMKNMLEILDLYEEFDLPMHISEITVPGSGRVAENEEVQAEIVETLYRTWFATKHMKSIVWWNLVDGYAAYAPLGSEEGENRYGGGLVRFDMTKKPAYEVLDRLINHEWHTELESTCDDGELTFRGFFGDYEITVEDAHGTHTYTVTLTEDAAVVSLESSMEIVR